MKKEIVLKHMQNYVIALKSISCNSSLEKSKEMYDTSTNLIKELKSLNEQEIKWFEQKYVEWLKQEGLFNPQPNYAVPGFPLKKMVQNVTS